MDPSDDGDSENGDDDMDFGEDLQFDSDLVHDIEELGEEERKMLQSLEADADETDIVVGDATIPEDPVDVKIPANGSSSVENGLGKSEDDAISLSDDEEEQVEATTKSPVNNSTSEGHVNNTKPTVSERIRSNPALLSDDLFDGCRMYRVCLNESNLGVEIILHGGRIVVSAVRPERIARWGPNSKPSVGDILCGIKGHSLAFAHSLPPAIHFLKYILRKPPIEFNFIEAPKFTAMFKLQLDQTANQDVEVPPTTSSTGNVTQHQQEPLQIPPQASTKRLPDIIELLDDD